MPSDEVCMSRYGGITYQCPCVLPAGHSGLHECEHGLHWRDRVET